MLYKWQQKTTFHNKYYRFFLTSYEIVLQNVEHNLLLYSSYILKSILIKSDLQIFWAKQKWRSGQTWPKYPYTYMYTQIYFYTYFFMELCGREKCSWIVETYQAIQVQLPVLPLTCHMIQGNYLISLGLLSLLKNGNIYYFGFWWGFKFTLKICVWEFTV